MELAGAGELMTTVYVSIGNSDDKLTQAEWSAFIGRTFAVVECVASRIYGSWHSAPESSYQNACTAFEVDENEVAALKAALRSLARVFRQDSIAWATAETEFLGPVD